MKFAVLGGSRFIGANLIPELLTHFKGCEIHVINRGVTPPVIEYDKKNARVFHHIADRTSPLNFKDSLEKIADAGMDAVIDLSCYAKDELTPAIRAFSKKIKQYIFISTGSVYGNLKYCPATEQHPLDSSDENSMYGREKIKCEKELFYSHKTGDFKATVLRPTYVYGRHDYTQRLFYFIDRIYKQVPVFIPSAGEDWLFNAVYVKDLAAQICFCLLNEKFYGEAFNAAARDTINFTTFLNTIGSALSKEVKIVYVTRDEFKKAAPGAVFPYSTTHTSFDCAKFRAITGEENFPFTPYEKALVETVEWHEKRGELPSSNNYENELKYFKNMEKGA